MGKLYYLMGKSASGKDTLYEMLLADSRLQLTRVVLWTTRPMRSGETEGVEYHFTDEQTARRMQEEGRVIELRTYQTACGPWMYFTADDGQTDLERGDYLSVGTLESFAKIRNYFGNGRVVPLYVEVEDGLRLLRALERERRQEEPKYEELCRRFLADQKDFSEEKLKEAGISVRIRNDAALEESFQALRGIIESGKGCL